MASGLFDAPPMVLEAMNRALCEIGIRYPEWTPPGASPSARCGVYCDLKVPKVCISGYATRKLP